MSTIPFYNLRSVSKIVFYQLYLIKFWSFSWFFTVSDIYESIREAVFGGNIRDFLTADEWGWHGCPRADGNRSFSFLLLTNWRLSSRNLASLPGKRIFFKIIYCFLVYHSVYWLLEISDFIWAGRKTQVHLRRGSSPPFISSQKSANNALSAQLSQRSKIERTQHFRRWIRRLWQIYSAFALLHHYNDIPRSERKYTAFYCKAK